MQQTREKIANAIRATGEGESRAYYCSASHIFGPVTFDDLLSGAEFPQDKGIYIIWGELGQDRPLYIGMTTRGSDRPLYHLRTPHHSPVGDILKNSKPACLNWTVFFCPLLGDIDSRDSWLPCVLHSFERKIAKGLSPWFWHGGLYGDLAECPYVKLVSQGVMSSERKRQRFNWLSTSDEYRSHTRAPGR